MNNYSFRPGWVATVAVILLLPLFVSLGVWQLRRADEKKGLMAQREQRQTLPILQSADDWARDENRYRRVELTGEWDGEHQFLLDNQIFKQQAGYQVLTPLRLAGGADAVLINRGWVPVGQNRRNLPKVPIGPATVRLIGVIDQYQGVGFHLKGAEIPAPGWPSVVQLLDAERLAERLGYRLLPYQVLLPADAAQAYARDWKPASLNPEKNQGYAVQWFAFALALSFVYVWYGRKPKPSNPER